MKFNKVAKRAILVNNDRWIGDKTSQFTVTGWGWQKVTYYQCQYIRTSDLSKKLVDSKSRMQRLPKVDGRPWMSDHRDASVQQSMLFDEPGCHF